MKQNLTISSTFIFIFFFFFTLSASADIPLGSTLSASTPNQTWPSPNNSFSLRFLPLNSSSFSLSITYDSLSIWSISAVADSAATFSFLADGNLRLLSGAGNLLWQSNTSNSGVSHATLDDSGNFSLKNRSNSVVWSTFDHPTNTIVPSQNFNVGMVLSSGLYSFTLNRTGNLTLQWNKDIVYWSLGLNDTVSSNLSNPRLQLQSIGILSLNDGNLTGSVIMAYGSDYAESGDILRFLRLDNDGNLRIYSSSKGSGSATVRWTAVSDQCQVFGYCGNMGICSYNDTSPVCGCPSENFVSVDPNDSKKGCKLKREIKDCPGSVAMLQMEHTKFLTYAPETLNDVYFVGISACRGNCLSGSSCVASTTLADGSGQCYIKTSRFVSGYESAALPSTSYVKVCAPAEPNAPPSSEDGGGKEKLQGWIIAVVVLGTLVGLILLEGSLWWWCCRKSPKFGGLSAQYALLEYASGAPVQFSYKDLQQATRNFKEKLGAGGFGAVYKGILANRTVAAVKQLEGIEQGEKQFRMEVATISSTHHLNLVRLIGFCSEGKHRLLVYEFMKNGSLDSFLFATEDESGRLLSWEHRFNIALGTARGITYLHEECRDCIVHCDINRDDQKHESWSCAIIHGCHCCGRHRDTANFGSASNSAHRKHHTTESPLKHHARNGHLVLVSPIEAASEMEAFLSAHVVKVPVCHVKQFNYSLFTPSSPRLNGKLHRSAFGMMKSFKLTNSVAASIQPVEASTTERFDNTLPSKEVLDLWRNVDAVCFDVDSTVCVDEGIDEFAEFCGAGKAVAEWTSRAMNGSVTFQEALAARLSLINPTLSQLQDYLEKRPPRLSPGIAELVKKLKAKGIDVYLVSGGFRQMINPVASILEIPLENIFANQMLFGDSGEFLGFDENEPTSRSGGKPIAVQQIRKARGYNTLAMIGDGATDLEARQPGGADLFICFAGVQLREAVAAKADWLVFNFKDLINSLD